MKLYSVIINWNDRDADEGTFGTTVRAKGALDAIRQVGDEMRLGRIKELEARRGT